MADTSRIDQLRRRVQADPASFAFAALGEEYRKAGRLDDAVETCRAGLARHPAYVSARATLGRALLERGDVEAARLELEQVLRAAPENLTALRALAEVHRRAGETQEAVARLELALSLAPGDREVLEAMLTVAQPHAAGETPASVPIARPADLRVVALEQFLAAIERARDDLAGEGPLVASAP